jgi:mRNA interferase MazF
MSPTFMSEYKAGDIILVDVPFTDLSKSKKRPAAILLSRGSDYLIMFLTSRIERAGETDVVITASPNNGLTVDSVVLVTRLFTIHQSLIVRALGQLARPDHRAVVERLVRLLKLR